MTAMARKSRASSKPVRVGKARLPVHDKAMKNTTGLAGMLESIKGRPSGLGFETFDPSSIELGVMLKRARETRGFTQTELGDLVGLKQGQISEIESGNKPEGPSFRKLRPLLSTLGLKFVLDAPTPPSIEDWVHLVSDGKSLKLNDESVDLEACATLVRSLIRGKAFEETRLAINGLIASSRGRANLFEPGVCGFWSVSPGKAGKLAAKRGLLVMGLAGSGTVSRTSKTSVPSSSQVVVASGQSHIAVTNTGDDSFDFMTVPLTMEIAGSLGAKLPA